MNYSNFKKIILFILLTAVVVGFSSVVVNVSFAQSLNTNTNLNVDTSLFPSNVNTNQNINTDASVKLNTGSDLNIPTTQSSQPSLDVNTNLKPDTSVSDNIISNSSSNGSQNAVNGNSILQTKTAADQYRETGAMALAIETFASYVLSATASLVDYAIQVGGSLTKLNAVKTGWSIMLSFANLGFVLAIIVIAFATILRRDSYAMKSTLSKLIIAALLVNFSLVIAGAFISVSNTVSNIFLNATTASSLSNALGHAMQPQQFWKGKDLSGWSVVAGKLSYFLQYIVSLFFILIFTALMVLAMITLFIMLLIRIIALMILLIVSPVVWLLWIFPNTQKHWQKWWTEFIRWNIFAPTVLLFIYLTIVVAGHTNELGTVNDSMQQSGLLISSDFMQHAANLLVILGFLVGGLFVANTFGIMGGSWGYSVAQNTGKGVVNWSKRFGQRWGTYPLRRKNKEGKSLAERAVDFSSKSKLRRFTLGWAAQGLTKISAKGAGVMSDYDKQAGALSLEEAKAAFRTSSFLTASSAYKVALIKRLDKDKALGDVDIKEVAKTESAFNNYGQAHIYDGIIKRTGQSKDVQSALASNNDADLKSAVENLVKKLNKGDIVPSYVKSFYKDSPAFGNNPEQNQKFIKAFASAVAKENHALVGTIISGLPAKEKDKFIKDYNEGIDRELIKLRSLLKASPDDKKVKETIEKLEKAHKDLDATITINSTSISADGAATPQPQPQPQPKQ